MKREKCGDCKYFQEEEEEEKEIEGRFMLAGSSCNLKPETVYRHSNCVACMRFQPIAVDKN